MEHGESILSSKVRVPRWVFWPVFLVTFSCLLVFVRSAGNKRGPGPTGVQAWRVAFRDFPALSGVRAEEYDLALSQLAYDTLVLASLAFIVAWVCAVIVGAVRSRNASVGTSGDDSTPFLSLGANRRSVSLIAAVLAGIMIPFLWELLPYGFRHLVWPVEELALSLSFAVLYALTSLVLARVYKEHQRLAGWEGVLFFLYVGLCLTVGIPLGIEKYDDWNEMKTEYAFSGNWLTTEQSMMERLCSPGRTNYAVASKDDPVRYWQGTLANRDGNATLDMDGVTIVFVGANCLGTNNVRVQIAGPGDYFHATGSGLRRFSQVYRNGVSVFASAGYAFKIENEGKVLVFDSKEVALDKGKPTVLVGRDGSIRLVRDGKEEKPNDAP